MTNNKQWIEKTLSHEETGAVPYDFMFSPPIFRRLRDHYSATDLEDYLNFPIRMTGPTTIKPLYADPAEFGESAKDEYGVTWSTSEIDRGSPVVPCLTEPDLTNYRFPQADEPYRFRDIGQWCSENESHYRVIWVGDLWERATFMRGMEDILMDVAAKPEFVEGLLRGIADYILQTMKILFGRFDFECVALSDDYGTQRSMIISPSAWRRLVKPVLSEIYSFAKDNGRTVFHHSCGSFLPIIPDMIDIGLDILHPIQPEAMDVLDLKREFGADLTFCGGVPTQYLLNDGTPEEVRSEVRRLNREMGKGGGYILEPGITIQADIPFENVLTLIEEARGVR